MARRLPVVVRVERGLVRRGEEGGEGVHGGGDEGVVGPDAALVPGEDPGLDEDLEMMRDRRLGEAERLRQVADARLAALVRGDHRDQPQPGRVGQRLERAGQAGRLVGGYRLPQQGGAALIGQQAERRGRLGDNGIAHLISMRQVLTVVYP